ncbi:MAG: hypothetical protein ABIG98_08795 [Chloroflexota bacterium]
MGVFYPAPLGKVIFRPTNIIRSSDRVNRVELETFLRSVPNPVLLGVFEEGQPQGNRMEKEIAGRALPEGVVFAGVTLRNDPGDVEIAELLALEEFPTVIAFCRGEEVGRTSNPSELDALVANLRRCGMGQG